MDLKMPICTKQGLAPVLEIFFNTEDDKTDRGFFRTLYSELFPYLRG